MKFLRQNFRCRQNEAHDTRNQAGTNQRNEMQSGPAANTRVTEI